LESAEVVRPLITRARLGILFEFGETARECWSPSAMPSVTALRRWLVFVALLRLLSGAPPPPAAPQ
jgi:hypothetical protein